jgi:putative glycosyltransferase
MNAVPPVALSIVTSMYRSAAFLNEFHTRCTAAAARLGIRSYEIVFVNDGSPDDSLRIAIELNARDPHVRVIDLSRNFGHHKALMTGLAHARGELVFLVDCDLEEDPDWLVAFHETIKTESVDVVYGVQAERKGDWVERAAGRVFFSLFNRMLTHPIPVNVVTARLMTARYVKALVSHRERELCLAGLWAITGVRPAAAAGTQGVARRFLLHHAQADLRLRQRDYVVQQPAAGLHLPDRHGRDGALGCGRRRAALSQPHRPNRRAGLGVGYGVDLVLGGLIIFCVGVIGMYLAKIFTEVKQRPYTIVARRVRPRSRSRVMYRTPETDGTHEALRNQAREYYEAKLRAHGATPAGMDWNSAASQELRFSQLAYLWQHEPDASCSTTAAATARWPRTCGAGRIAVPTSALMSAIQWPGRRGALAKLSECHVTSVRASCRPADLRRRVRRVQCQTGRDPAMRG